MVLHTGRGSSTGAGPFAGAFSGAALGKLLGGDCVCSSCESACGVGRGLFLTRVERTEVGKGRKDGGREVRKKERKHS